MRQLTNPSICRTYHISAVLQPSLSVFGIFVLGLVLASALLCQTKISAQEDKAEKTVPFYELTRDIRDANPNAAGNWHYDLYSGDELLGDMTVALSLEPCSAGTCYVMAQQGTFQLSATDTRKITSRAVLKPDLTLLEYQKKEQAPLEDGTLASRSMKAVVGGLSVTTVTESEGAPQEKLLRKTGPVYLAPAATWLLVRALSPEKGIRYTYDAFNPERMELLAADIRIAGAVVSKTDSGTEQVYRILAFNGDSTLMLDVDSQGRIVAYGPEDGSMEFRLRK